MDKYSVLGKTITPLHASEKATGKAVYAGDLHFPGMLIGKFCRSTLPHARILHIDTSLAEKLPGVKAVITARDAPRKRIGRWVYDRAILTDGKVRHIGEPVAAVAAVDEDTAEEAVSLIRVEYAPLPVICDVFEAMKEGAPLIHENLATYESAPPARNSSGNIMHRVRIVTGDAEKALSGADVVHQESYFTRPAHQGFIQPHQAVATLSPSGKVTLWDSTKSPFVIRAAVSEVLGIPMTSLRVIAARVGGDFGGKGTASIEPVCVLLALKSGYPVKIALDYGEELTATFIRTRSFIDLTSGASRDGSLVAFKGRVVFDLGAYNDALTGYTTTYNLLHGPYSIPNLDIEARVVYTNNTPTGHYRAPRSPQQAFAMESHLDGLARKLGLDPLDFRLRNAIKKGQKLAAGGVFGDIGIEPTIRAAKDFVLKNEGGKKAPGEGWGVACAWWSVSRVGEEGQPSTAWVKFNEDGTAILFTGCAEQGGGQHDILTQIVAEILGIPTETISLVTSDTDTAPYERGTGGSQTTYRVGNAVRLAAEDARRQLLDVAAAKLKVKADDLHIEAGRIFRRAAPEQFVTIASLCAEAITSARGPIVGIGEDLREERLARSREEKDLIDGAQTATHAVKVAVDRETGKVRILKYFASQDAGMALNKRNVEAQMDGGIVQAMGFALSEELVTENCRTLNTTLADYRMPRASDAPQIEKSIVEVPSKYGPFGARGVGEPPHIPVGAAIANAIYDAVGVRIRDLPLTSAKIAAALKEKSGP